MALLRRRQPRHGSLSRAYSRRHLSWKRVRSRNHVGRSGRWWTLDRDAPAATKCPASVGHAVREFNVPEVYRSVARFVVRAIAIPDGKFTLVLQPAPLPTIALRPRSMV